PASLRLLIMTWGGAGLMLMHQLGHPDIGDSHALGLAQQLGFVGLCIGHDQAVFGIGGVLLAPAPARLALGQAFLVRFDDLRAWIVLKDVVHFELVGWPVSEHGSPPIGLGTALLTRRSSYSFEAFGLAGRPPDGRGREWGRQPQHRWRGPRSGAFT